jgi:hypothetical protein
MPRIMRTGDPPDLPTFHEAMPDMIAALQRQNARMTFDLVAYEQRIAHLRDLLAWKWGPDQALNADTRLRETIARLRGVLWSEEE